MRIGWFAAGNGSPAWPRHTVPSSSAKSDDPVNTKVCVWHSGAPPCARWLLDARFRGHDTAQYARATSARRVGTARKRAPLPTLRRRHPDPLDLPFELDAGILFHARPHRLAQGLDVGGGGAAEIDQEVAVHLRHLGAADREAAAAGGVDDLPGLVAGRVLEGRAAGAALDRLGGLARLGDLVHLGGDLLRIAGLALEQRGGEDHVVGRAAMAIAVMHVAVGKDVQAAGAVDAARLDQRVLGLAAIGAAVHTQRPAD